MSGYALRSLQPTHGVRIGRGTVTFWKDEPITSRPMAAECAAVIEEWTGERGEIVEVVAPTPLLDRATLTRLTTEDFPLTDHERDLLRNPAERYLLEDAFREVIDLDQAAQAAVELWRERRA